MRKQWPTIAGLTLVLCLVLRPAHVRATTYYVVNTTDDDTDAGGCEQPPGGDCTLREAIAAAEAHLGQDIVAFDIPNTDPNYTSATGVWTIILGSRMETLQGGDVVDGTTQATNYGSDANPYGPEIEISGQSLGVGITCWYIGGTAGSVIKGLVMNRCPAYGLWIAGDNNQIVGNYIGTDPTGTVDQGVGLDGILAINGAELNTIGGLSDAERNVISGNVGAGVRISGSSTGHNVVKGNYIGVDRTGTKPLANLFGVEIQSDAQDNTVGPDNVIAHNASYGVVIDGSATTGNSITENSIHSNGGLGIALTNGANDNIQPPTVSNAGCTWVGGATGPNLQVEVFSDTNGEGRFYQVSWGSSSGSFTAQLPAGDLFRYPYVTLTATDPISGTSQFSAPYPSGCEFVYLPVVMKNF